MTVQHHLDHATLVRYASGDLDEAFSIIAASHLAMCEPCQRAARKAENFGGQLLEEIDQMALRPDAFNSLLNMVDNNDKRFDSDMQPRARTTTDDSDIPTPLQRFVGTSLDQISWTPVAPGVRKHMIKLQTKPSSSLYLLRIAAGKAVPEHGHGGSEITLILSGAYRDEMGVFGPGDIEDLDENIEHQPKVTPDAPCICLVATEAPTKFKGIFSRMLQPLIGI